MCTPSDVFFWRSVNVKFVWLLLNVSLMFLQISTGVHPFVEIGSDPFVVVTVMSGIRPSRPPEQEDSTMSDGLWGVVQDCWKHEPSDRLTMAQVIDRLKAMDFGIGL